MEKRIMRNDVIPGCEFTATAATDEELLTKIAAHRAARDRAVNEVTLRVGSQGQGRDQGITSTRSKLAVMVVPEEATDDELVARTVLGDNQAFDEITIRYQARAYRLACRLVGSDDAPDVIQEAFLSVYRSLGSFRRESRFGTWLYRIVTNAALMHRRARARRPAETLETFLPEFDEAGQHRRTPAQLQIAARADELLDRRLLAEKAAVALDRLPDLYRSAFVLRDLEELTTAEVADVLGVEPATVRQRVHRARLMLRGYLSALVGETS